jgi:plastocyanin
MRAPLASYRHCVLLLVCLLVGRAVALAQRVSVGGSVEVSKAGENKVVDQSNVAIWLVPLSTAGQAPAPSESRPGEFVLHQRNKTFSPHLLVVPVGAAVNFPNHDPIFHNVFSLFEGKRFDLGLYEAGSSRTIRFDRAGVSYVFCNIHPEMGAVVIALRTPYFAISDRKGKILLNDVPAGRYILHLWQEAAPPEMLNAMRREVTISAEASSLGTIRLQLPRAQNVAHKNKYGQDYPKPPSGLYEQR